MSESTPSVTWRDSRRLTGPSLLLDVPGAVLEAHWLAGGETRLIEAWRAQAAVILGAIGWPTAPLATRPFPGGAILAIGAPLDALYSATLVNEWACEAADAELAGAALPPLDSAAAAIERELRYERDPALLAMAAAAEKRGVAFVAGDGKVSVGLGAGALVWPYDQLPAPEVVDWAAVRDVPVILVTGTNGKSTTVRLIAAMARAAGKVAGLSSSDWVRVGDDILDKGDYSGPGGARLAMRDPRVEIGVLELARGGILRRGLPLARASAALVTNVASDHLGEYGIYDLDGIADTKLVVAKALLHGGRLIVNADDPRLAERAPERAADLSWFGMAPGGSIRDGAALEDGLIVLRRGGRSLPVLPAADVRIAMGGAARHNVANALAAVAGADRLGLPVDAMAQALRSFGADEADNPGRGVLREIAGVKVLVDFAHNPHGIAAVAELVANIPAQRRLVLLGQAGDRTDAEIKALACAVWTMRPDRIVIKEMESYLRGREPGEIPALLRAELSGLGAAADTITVEDSETAAVRSSFGWAREGDLLVLLSHAARARTLAFLDQLEALEWRAGQTLPGS